MATFNQENIHLAFQYLLPLSEYHLFSDDYADVEWMDSRTQPTEDAVNTAIPLAIAAEKLKEIRSQRNAKLIKKIFIWLFNICCPCLNTICFQTITLTLNGWTVERSPRKLLWIQLSRWLLQLRSGKILGRHAMHFLHSLIGWQTVM